MVSVLHVAKHMVLEKSIKILIPGVSTAILGKDVEFIKEDLYHVRNSNVTGFLDSVKYGNAQIR